MTDEGFATTSGEVARRRRLFLAIDVPAPLRRLIAQVQTELRPLLPSARWTRSEAMHITVKFLGAVDTLVVGQVEAVAAAVAARHAGSVLPLLGLGGAPGLRRPRVVWVDCQASPEVARLQADLQEDLSTLGIPRETRPFRPHITLARVDPRRARPTGPLVLSPTLASALCAASIPVTELVLFESVPRQDGVRYVVLRRFGLG